MIDPSTFLARAASLADEGRNLVGRVSARTSDEDPIDEVKFAEWRTKVGTLLSHVIAEEHVHWPKVAGIVQLPRTPAAILDTVGFLRGIRDDFDKGFLTSLSNQIESEIASDYLAQAAGLLDENHEGKFHHIPAVVLAGAVLEKALRSLCEKREPPIPSRANGKFKMMKVLVEALKNARVLNKAQSAQISVWIILRNHAAHGEFDQVKREEVEAMVSGVQRFVREAPTA
jgi:hypothetical protein